MPRWFPVTIAIVALLYGGVMTYAYLHEKDKADTAPASVALFGAGYLERELPLAWTRDEPRETLKGVVCVLREGHNYKCVATAVPTRTALELASQPDDSDAEIRATRDDMSHKVALDVTLNPRNGKFVTNVP